MPKYTRRKQNKFRRTLRLRSNKGGAINDAINAQGRTALYIAARDNNIAKVEELIAAGADVNKTRADIGATPLYIACEMGHTNVVENLIAAGADVNKARTDNGATPLYLACEMGHTNIVENLIAYGADVDKARTDNGATPLYIASLSGHTNVVEKLIAYGADVDKARTDNGATPLYVASEKGHTEVVKVLVLVSDVNKAFHDGSTPLYIASQNGHVEIVKVLISDPRTDVNKPYGNISFTPLYIASQNGHVEIVKVLVSDPRTDLNKARTDNGASPLYVASQKGHANVVEKLIAAGADINKPKNDGTTPLYIACKNNHIDVVELLLNQPTIDKTRAVQEANTFSEEITKLLIGEQEEKGELWQGWTRTDVEHMNEIFDETTAPNISLCPICLKTTTRDTGCMHMKHDCRSLPGFYHKRLYDLYKSDDNAIHWCTICGRIGYGIGSHFEHYKLGLAENGKPGTHGPTQVFDESCETRSGGGGLKEKLKRFQRVREIAFKLNKPRYINKITEKAAKEMLVEAMWDAPLFNNPDINEILETRSWNIPVNAFLENVKKESEVSQAPNVPTPATHLDPIVHPEETEEFQNVTIASDKNIIQFRHEGNMHDKEGQQISRDGFAHWLQSVGVNPTDEGHLKCWAFHEEGENECTVKLYPREVRIALGLSEVAEEGENADYRKWYELYRKKFNEAEAGLSGGARRRRTCKRY